ncbi:hypothetical protein HN011_001987 [Eciton burchellii]|nr:hypothetical protein HN011_001987 [Eciton burchellii]
MCMGYVLAYVRGMSGIKYGQDLWSKMPKCHVFRKLRLGQRAIAKKALGAWDDVILYKGQETGQRQTDRRTTNRLRTSNRRIEGASQRCIPKSGKRVSNGEATESIGLSIRVVSVKQNKESCYFLFHQPSVENPFI